MYEKRSERALIILPAIKVPRTFQPSFAMATGSERRPAPPFALSPTLPGLANTISLLSQLDYAQRRLDRGEADPLYVYFKTASVLENNRCLSRKTRSMTVR